MIGTPQLTAKKAATGDKFGRRQLSAPSPRDDGPGPMMGGLPRRDLWLLPLISLATLVAVLLCSEIAARAIWPEQLFNSCRQSDPQVGVRYRANCSTTMKTPEGPWYVASYNDCGYRSDAPCATLPLGERRIALLGASLAEGYLVEYPDTIGARLEAELTRRCGLTVDLQNLGTLATFGKRLVPQMDEALALHPSAVLLLAAPFDIKELTTADAPAAMPAATAAASFEKRAFEALKESRAVAMAQHFLFRNPSIYLPLYLRYGDEADFMRPPFTAPWQARLRAFDQLVGALAARAQAAGVAFGIAFVPQEAQIALLAGGRAAAPAGIDPAALQAAIAKIANRHSALFIDTSLALQTVHAPEHLYYQVDGHLSGEGQPIAAAYIAQQLAQPGGPFARCGGTVAASLRVTQ